MFNESVAQYPIIAVSDGTKTGKNSPSVWNLPGCARSGPKPLAFETAHHNSAPVITSTNGAAQFSTSRSRAGTFDPIVPYAARANTGKGMPYLVPGCELSRIGTRTIVFPRRMVISACDQFMPAAINPEASM